MNVKPMTFEIAVKALEKRGYKVSAGSFEDDQQIYVYSVSCDKNCMNHPNFSLQYFKGREHYKLNGKTVCLF